MCQNFQIIFGRFLLLDIKLLLNILLFNYSAGFHKVREWSTNYPWKQCISVSCSLSSCIEMSLKIGFPQMKTKVAVCTTRPTISFVILPDSYPSDSTLCSERMCVTENLLSTCWSFSKCSRNQISLGFLLNKIKLMESLKWFKDLSFLWKVFILVHSFLHFHRRTL